MSEVRHTVELIIAGPIGGQLERYDRSKSPDQQAHSIEQGFIDAMKVREEVFVKEQKVPLEAELDEDDARCIHITAYASKQSSTSGDEPRSKHHNPIGTIRIVPLPNIMHHEYENHRTWGGSPYTSEPKSKFHDGSEPFIKLGRLAVTRQSRGTGVAGRLVEAACDLASKQPSTMQPKTADAVASQQAWRGLILIHAQRQVQGFWSRSGFEIDEDFGIWEEEQMDHVAMWRRISLG